MIRKLVTSIILCLLICTAVCSAQEQYDGYIVKLRDSGVSFLGEGVTLADVDSSFENVVPEWNMYTTDSLENIAEYEQAGLVECVVTNDIYKLHSSYTHTPTDPRYSQQYELAEINLEKAWSMGVFGEGVTIGLVDSGVSWHADISDNIIAGYNYVGTATDPTDYSDNVGTAGHGTMCASVIAAVTNRTNVTGVAPKAKIVALKALDQLKNGQLADIVRAIKDAVDVYNCDIINMSFGSTSDNAILKEAIDYAASKGAILVASAGNESTTKIMYPAGYANVINVGSVGMTINERISENYATSTHDAFRKLSSFSNYGTALTVVAPGASIMMNGRTNSEGANLYYDSGTSFSAPMVSAIAALCKSVKPELTHVEFEQLLIDTCEDLGTEGKDIYFGYGLVDAGAAVEKLVKEKDIYVSPIAVINTDAFQIVNNNTNTDASYADIWNREGKLTVSTLTAPAATRTYTGITAYATDMLTHYLWDSFESLKPIFKHQINQPANQE